jgi:hypothetical protein
MSAHNIDVQAHSIIYGQGGKFPRRSTTMGQQPGYEWGGALSLLGSARIFVRKGYKAPEQPQDRLWTEGG